MRRRRVPGARAFWRDRSGVSAVEFALLAPLIFFSLLTMFDIGMAVRASLELDHLLRSGAQAAMRDEGESAVLDALKQSTCTAEVTYPDDDCAALAQVAFEPAPDRYCVCPQTGAVDATCTATCAVRPQTFYALAAQKSYDSVFLPQFDFAPSVLVEVR